MAEIPLQISVSKSDETLPNRQQHFHIATGQFDRLPNVILTRCWSPIIWHDGLRRKDKFKSSQLIALDFDNGKMTLGEAIHWAKSGGLAHIIATTKSHQKEKSGLVCDRFRMILRSELCTSVDDFEYTMKVYSENLPCDPACKDGGRFYYPSVEIISVSEGMPVKWLECPVDQTAAGRAVRDKKFYQDKHRNVDFPRYILTPLIHGVDAGKREKTAHVMGYYFARTGWTEDEALEFFKDFNSPILLEIGEKEVRHALATAYRHVSRTAVMALDIKGGK